MILTQRLLQKKAATWWWGAGDALHVSFVDKAIPECMAKITEGESNFEASDQNNILL